MAPLILITGATGHLGFRTLVLLLQDGYRARVAHRRPEQVDQIKQAASIKPFVNSVEFALVPDITAPHAYDEAIKGVDGVLHIASPLHTGLGPGDTDWKTLLYDPAEQGVLRLLNAALQEPQLKRIVMTSSVVVLEPKNGSNRAGRAHELYTSSAQLSNTKTSGSNEGVMNTALGNYQGFPRITAQVLLEDVAQAHVLALREEVAKGGESFSVVGNGGDSVDWKEYVDVIESLFPEAVREGILRPGVRDVSFLTYWDVRESERKLGFRFKGKEEMVRSVVGQYVELVKAGT